MKKETPIVYLYLYKQLLEKEENPMDTRIVIEELKRNLYKFPTILLYKILKEMKDQGLIKRISHKKYRLLYEKEDETKRIVSPLLLLPFIF